MSQLPSRRHLASAAAVAVLASLLVVGPAAAHACATHPLSVRLNGFANGFGFQDPPHYYWGAEGGGNVGILFNAFGHDCSGQPTSLKWSTVNGTAVAPGDFTAVNGKQEHLDGTTQDGEESFADATVTVNNDPNTENAVETFKVKIDSSPHGSLNHGYPIEAPVHVVDNEGPLRVGFPAGVSPTIRELDGHFAVNPDVRIPVFRAGPSTTGNVVVNYTITPADDGYTDLTGGSVTIPSGQRRALIDLAIKLDNDGTDEVLKVTLTGGATLAEHTTATVTIDDNYFPGSDTTAPSTSFHHPKHNKVYKAGNLLARTIHVFAPGPSLEPAGIDWAQTALRRKKTNGSCQWLKANGNWAKDKCGKAGLYRHWLPTWFFDEWNNKEIWEYPKSPKIMDKLKPSQGTKIKNYFVYSRAADNLGNVEDTFQLGRNKNRFEIKKA
jgi:hypothetical protein